MSREVTPVINLDELTYAGNLRNLERISSDARYHFLHGDIARSRPGSPVAARAPAGRGRTFCGGEPRRSIDLRTGRLYSHKRFWDFLPDLKKRERTGAIWTPVGGQPSDFCTFRLTKYMDRWDRRTLRSAKPPRMRRIFPTRLRRRLRTTWSGRTTTPTNFLCSQPTVPTTTGHTSFLRN